MPGKADRIGFVYALTLCAAGLCGCYSNGSYSSFNNAAVFPSQQILAPQAMSSGGSVGTLPATTQFPIYTNTSAVPSNVVISNGDTATEPGIVANTQSAKSLPDLSHIYGRTAQSDDRDRNPIIVIPGVLGSRLVDQQSGLVVWGEFGGDSINPLSPWGARMIALPMRQGQKLTSLTTPSVKAAGTLDALDVRLLGIPFQINAYRDLLNALGVGGYRDPQTNLADVDYGNQSYSSFQFAYDWRRDNVENARLLHRFILEKKAYVENARRARYQTDIEPVRFDIVAHSMGGLVARYYLEYGDADLPDDGSVPEVTWAGAENVARLVMIGTPNAGSLDAIANLVQGETLSRFLPRYEAAILGTMPSLYQLLPRSRQNPVISDANRKSIDLFDPQVWWQYRWGLLDPRQFGVLEELLAEVANPQERLQIAYDHLSKCLARAKAFQAALDTPASPPDGTTIHLIAGDAHPTVAQFRVDGSGALTVSAVHPGDSRVCRSSALMDERQSAGVAWSPRLVSPIKWNSVNFLFADHLGLTSDPGFTDNILFLLLESSR
jgi:pimeloyl-ACP methyl ester carboxylesterase